jgi:hypothetical protein
MAMVPMYLNVCGSVVVLTKRNFSSKSALMALMEKEKLAMQLISCSLEKNTLIKLVGFNRRKVEIFISPMSCQSQEFFDELKDVTKK